MTMRNLIWNGHFLQKVTIIPLWRHHHAKLRDCHNENVSSNGLVLSSVYCTIESFIVTLCESSKFSLFGSVLCYLYLPAWFYWERNLFRSQITACMISLSETNMIVPSTMRNAQYIYVFMALFESPLLFTDRYFWNDNHWKLWCYSDHYVDSLYLPWLILDPRSQQVGSYKFGAVIVNGSQSVSEWVSQWVS